MKFKKAFTLAEVVMFLVIIATIIAISFVTTKPTRYIKHKAIKAKYATVYDALNSVVFELAGKEETDPFIRTPQDIENNVSNFKKLCTGLVEYLNTDSDNCNIPYSGDVGFMTNESLDFRNLSPHITALNGVKFYISDMITDDKFPVDTRSYYNPADPTYTLRFFMIYADLNGTERPNYPHTILHDPSGKNVPDVFAFAAIPTGDIIPIGLAEYDAMFLAARISYKENNYIYYSPHYSYRKAKHLAWGWYSPNGARIEFKKTMAHTYNDYVKEILLRNNSKLYDFNKDGFYPETYDMGLYSKCNPPSNIPNLAVYDMCGLKMDTSTVGKTN